MNMLPTLQDLTEYDKLLIQDIVDFVDQSSCFEEVNQVLYPFIHKFNRNIHTRHALARRLETLCNAVFNYVVIKLRELNVMKCQSIQTAFVKWGKLRDKQKFRFVWLLVEDADMILLNKSEHFYENIADCLSAAWYFKPSIDYVDSRSFDLLTYEIVTSYEQDLLNELVCDNKQNCCSNDSKLLDHITSKGIRYSFTVTDHCATIRMPWRVPKGDDYLYIFYTKKSDNWFYCDNPNISRAYHERHHV